MTGEIDLQTLYESYIRKGSYFNNMLHCGAECNRTIEIALTYLPTDVLWDHRENLAFIGTMTSDAFRVASKLRERELIVLSDHIFPGEGSKGEASDEMRYFVFVILHEVAHAVCKHRSWKFDSLTEDENQAQEDDADELAYRWYNQHVADRANPHLLPITQSEIEKIQVRYRNR